MLGDDGGAVTDCVIADDDAFCRCVAANEGDSTGVGGGRGKGGGAI